MSIQHTYADDQESEITLTVDRNYETGDVTVTVRKYDAEESITLDLGSLTELMRHVGIGS